MWTDEMTDANAQLNPDMSGNQAAPFGRFERMVAWRYLGARRKESFISVIAAFTLIGIAIGVAALIVVMSVVNGFRAEVLSKLLGLNGHLTIQSFGHRFEAPNDLVDRLNEVDGVDFTVSYVQGEALASANSKSSGIQMRGYDLASLQKLPLLTEAIILGDLEEWDDRDGVMIGRRLAQNLNVTLGDAIVILSPDGDLTPFGRAPRIRTFSVAAIFDVGLFEVDGFFVFTSLRQAQNFFKLHRDELKPGVPAPSIDATEQEIDAAYQRVFATNIIEVFLNDPDSTAQAATKLLVAMPHAPSELILTDWQTRYRSFFSTLKVQGVVMFVILSLIVIVAAFNIISSLVMLVKDKSKDIAVMRTMGATRSSIMRIFCMTGAAIGIVGTVIGLGFGLLIAYNAPAIERWLYETLNVQIFPPDFLLISTFPSQVNLVQVVWVVFVALVLSFLATLYPAFKAAQYDPAEALRYE